MNWKELKQQIDNKEIQLSFSSLSKFAECPEHFVEYKLNPKPPTSAMLFGNLVHCFVLDPENLEDRYVFGIEAPSEGNQSALADLILNELIPVDETESREDRRKRLMKNKDLSEKKFEELFEGHWPTIYKGGSKKAVAPKLFAYCNTKFKGMEAASIDDKFRAEFLHDRLLKNPVSANLINSLTQTERGIEWEQSGWLMRGYIDGENDDLIMDMKVTDADPKKFARNFFDRNYHVQGAMYLDGSAKNGRPKKKFKSLVIEAKSGDISVHQVDQDFLYYGEHQYKLWLQDFTKCVMRNKLFANYEFYGRLRGEYLLKKPYWAPELDVIHDE